MDLLIFFGRLDDGDGKAAPVLLRVEGSVFGITKQLAFDVFWA